jgi:ATP-dependent Clp protease ATP-binding subunit ClpC
MGAAMDAANMLKPALVRGDIRVIGATTGEEYDKWVRSDPALERRFQPVTIDELDEIETWEVLVARRPRLERHHAVAISDDALKAAIVLTDRFVPERARPDKAIDVLDEACAHAQATAHVSPELDKLIRDRKKVEAMLRRGVSEEASAPEEPMPDLATVLQRFGEEIEELLGGRRRTRADESGAEPTPPSPAVGRPRPPLEEQRDELDRKLRQELERQGIVVTGKEVARVVAVAVDKGIEWTG